MSTVIVTPIIGPVNNTRLESMRACHALHEKAIRRQVTKPSDLGQQIESAVKELLLTDYMRGELRNADQVHFILTVKP